MRIELVGGLGIGKSTLCEVFSKKYGCTPVYEDLKSNPFLSMCYEDPDKFRFASQMWFALTKYHEIGLNDDSEKIHVHDQAILNNQAYTNMLFRDAKDIEGWDILNYTFWYTEEFLGRPDLLIYLKCDPVVQLERIQGRGRGFESGVDLNFINRFNTEIELLLRKAQYKEYEIVEADITDYGFEDYDTLAQEIMLLYTNHEDNNEQSKISTGMV